MEDKINIPLLDLHGQLSSLSKDINKTFKIISNTSSFIKGPFLEEFEKDFAEFTGTKHCIGVASGTDALQLSLMALGVGKGDEVIVPVNTFVATAYAVIYTGAKPVLVDVDEQTYNINVKLIEKSITKKTKAIIPVHLYGYPAKMNEINSLAKKYKLFVIEDAAQAHGAIYHKKRAGNLGTIAAFSFYPSKNLGAFGDGGAITTNDSLIAKRLRKLREYGQSERYIFDEIGLNSRLDAIQAAILRIKLKHLDNWSRERMRIANYYSKYLNEKLPFIITPHIEENITPVYHLYTIRSKNRNQLAQYLLEKGIQTGIYYPIPLHIQKALVYLGYKSGDFPVAESMCSNILSLPIYPGLTKKDQNYILKSIISFFKK